jgi:hypothetical protein
MSGSERLTSLDAFRGATVAAMLLVNNPGSWSHVYPPLRHAPWHGWTFTDLIFPCFLWIVGLSMALSFARRTGVTGRTPGADRGESTQRVTGLARHIVTRSAILFGLGLFLAAFPFGLLGDSFSLATLRIPGVLQRIALCFLIASPFVLYCRWRGQLLAALGLLAGYAALLLTVPVPGHGAGVLEPIGIDPSVVQHLGWQHRDDQHQLVEFGLEGVDQLLRHRAQPAVGDDTELHAAGIRQDRHAQADVARLRNPEHHPRQLPAGERVRKHGSQVLAIRTIAHPEPPPAHRLRLRTRQSKDAVFELLLHGVGQLVAGVGKNLEAVVLVRVVRSRDHHPGDKRAVLGHPRHAGRRDHAVMVGRHAGGLQAGHQPAGELLA